MHCSDEQVLPSEHEAPHWPDTQRSVKAEVVQDSLEKEHVPEVEE